MSPRTVERAPWAGVLDTGREQGTLVAESFESAKRGSRASLPDDLHPDLAAALARQGLDKLYRHQVEAWDRVREGHVMITSGTASGKSLAFNLPTLDVLLREPSARALYLYPTKALAQDQARSLAALRLEGLRHAVYDGDTPRDDRPGLRRKANLLLTNPDMLHVGVLPNHQHWGAFLRGLRYVVIDEAHTYRGIFGSHVANVLRRLRRLAAHYGGDPRFVLASATIANPGELGERLIGEECAVVGDGGAPRAKRQIAMWNPPLVDEAAGTRRSALSEAAELLASLIEKGVRTICFLKSRRGIELIQRFTAMELERRGKAELAELLAPYRAGYTPQQRREIERRLVEGELLAVVSTDALELGIDVGELDAAICVTFPGTVASLRQMWGRAGRRRAGLAVYVAGQDALDQFFCRHPDEFLDRPVESAILDHESEEIHMAHLAAAAYELPLGAGDEEQTLGPRWQGWADRMVGRGVLREIRGGRYGVREPDFVAGRISLRSASADSVRVVDAGSGEMVGTVEAQRAMATVHPGAVYLHMGRSYEVQQLDIAGRQALVRPFTGDYYTQPKKEIEIFVDAQLDARETLGCELHFGRVSVSERVIAFQRKRLGDHEVVDLVSLELPEEHFPTQALWYLPSDDALGELPSDVLLGALHASEHAQIAVLPLLAMCDRWDIGGLSTTVHFQTGAPTIFIYDGHPGGVGIARQGYASFERLVADASRLVGECPCESGCPSCVQSPKCGNLNDHLHKAAASELMRGMLAAADRPPGGAGGPTTTRRRVR
ncbi:MAG: DEAD/DEAH box helicase [Solirubrobacterales bacterium]